MHHTFDNVHAGTQAGFFSLPTKIE
jgi:hypothetical protein